MELTNKKSYTKRIFKVSSWFKKDGSLFEKGEKYVLSSFRMWLKELGYSNKDIVHIMNTCHLFEGQKLLFRTLDNKLNCIDLIPKVKVKVNMDPKSNLNLEDLILFAKRKSFELWKRDFDIEILLVNTRWKRMKGCYVVNFKTGVNYIKMSKHRNSEFTESEVYDTLLHEMVHWHLHTSGKPFGDGDKEFVEEILRVGSSFSGTNKAKKAAELYGKILRI